MPEPLREHSRACLFGRQCSHLKRWLLQEGKFILEKSMILKEDEYRSREAEAASEAEECQAAESSDAMMLDSPDTSPERSGAEAASEQEEADGRHRATGRRTAGHALPAAYDADAGVHVEQLRHRGGAGNDG
jgi:hypothetical protein